MTKQVNKASKSASSFKKRTAIDHHIRHRTILGLGIVTIAVLIGLVLALVILPKIQNDMRLSRINEIYATIQLPENTYFSEEQVFGDKRPYSYDAGRTFSSYKVFVVAKTVNETMDIVDAAVRGAGYTFFDEAYPGSTSKQYHYKTQRGEYIRLTVSSKLRDDAASNELLMQGDFSEAFFKIDPNSGPSTVTLKVNLDDNNE
jgi:hypothetical protein